jgi:hypothetical protein
MRAPERKLVEMLKNLSENYCLQGIKAELEVEGSMPDDLHRLKEITMAAGVSISLKIGGCEAISDMAYARVLGVGKIVAPMIESSFALNKFIDAAKRLFGSDELEDLSLVANIETITAFRAYDEIISIPQFSLLEGISIGRKDLTMSMGLKRDAIDSEDVFNVCKEILEKTKSKLPECICTIGGINGNESLDIIKRFDNLVDAYETRKVILGVDSLLSAKAAGAFKKALEFELLWYKTKREYYQRLSFVDEDYTKRIESVFNSI